MSKIQQHIESTLDLKAKRGEERQEYLERVVKEINAASDDDYNALGKGDVGKDALEWFDSACDAVEAKKDIPDFPDLPKEEEKTTSRRRSSSKDEDDKPAVTAEPKVGDKVKAVTKRGKAIEGKLVEIDDEVVVIEVDGEDEELQRSRLESLEVVGGKSKAKDADDEPADPIKVGAEVKVTNKRGKVFEGTIVELDEEVLVLKTSDSEEEIDRNRIETIELLGGKSKAKDEPKEEEKSTRRRSSSKDKDEAAGDEEGGRAGAGQGVQLRQMLVDTLAEDGALPSKEDFLKQAKKKFPDAKDNTLGIVHGEVHKLVEMLKKAKLLKL